MAGQERKGTKRRIRYFFVKVDDELRLHKVLHINRSQDLVTAWDYKDAKRRMYQWSDVKRTMQHAFGITQAAEILGLHRLTVDKAIRDGVVLTPQRTYEISTRKPLMYMFSADEVLDMHQAFSEIHQGRPRKDGLVTNNRMPNRQQVRTLVEQGDVLYTKDEGGNFVPIWKEKEW